MAKETIVCMIIIITIISLDFITQKYTENIFEQISSELSSVREESVSEVPSDEKIKKNLQEVNFIWNKSRQKLAYFIEHDELEKVEKNFTNLQSAIELQEYSTALSKVDESIFILNHIKDKNQFNLENIF